MNAYLKILLENDIYYDEANPKYRCLFNKFHSLKISKLITVPQIFVVLALFIYYFPQSAFSIPAIVLLISSTIYAYHKENAVALLPLNAYFIASTCALVLITILFMGISFYSYASVVFDFEEKTVSTLPQKISHIMLIVVVLVFFIVVYYWQMTVIHKCRLYFMDKHEQTTYMQLAIPESFVDTKITEKLPIQPKKPKAPVSENLTYSLEEISLDTVVEKIQEKIE